MSMPIEWEISTAGSTIDAALQRVNTAIDERSLLYWIATAGAGRVKESAAARFASEGGDVGGWAPLAPYTIQDRISKNYPPGPILHRSGELENYIVNGEPEIDVAGSIVELKAPGNAPNPEVEIKYEMTQGGSKKQPKRPVVALTDGDAEFLLESLKGYIVLAIEAG